MLKAGLAHTSKEKCGLPGVARLEDNVTRSFDPQKLCVFGAPQPAQRIRRIKCKTSRACREEGLNDVLFGCFVLFEQLLATAFSNGARLAQWSKKCFRYMPGSPSVMTVASLLSLQLLQLAADGLRIFVMVVLH